LPAMTGQGKLRTAKRSAPFRDRQRTIGQSRR
jgi:hypothetical protein